jgi:organic radical activating enzyme
MTMPVAPPLQHENPEETRPDYLPVWRADGQVLQVNEIFYSIEGEGLRVGQPTTFVRLARCNLRCHFCDTEFDSFTEMDLDEIVQEVERHPARWVCFTGGEPLGQNISPLARCLKERGYQLQIETNGVVRPDPCLFELIEHWTVSPKRHPIAEGFLRITELKYVVGKSFREDRVQEELAQYVYLQPESSEPRYVQKALEILTRHPHWRLSCRIHKVLGLP